MGLGKGGCIFLAFLYTCAQCLFFEVRVHFLFSEGNCSCFLVAINLPSASISSFFQAEPSRQVDDAIIIELQQRIRDLQEKLDSVGSYEVEEFFQTKQNIATCIVFNKCSLNYFNNSDHDHEKKLDP